MQIMKRVLVLVFVALGAQAQSGISIGQLALGGNACRLGGAGPLDVTIENGKLQIPAASLVNKSAGSSLERGACAFTLPIQLAPGYRLILKDVAAMGDLNLARGATSRISLEVFAAGSQGDVLTATDGSPNRRVRKTLQLNQPGEVLATACGEALNLRGNSSTLLQGPTAMNSPAALHLIEMSAEVEKCN